MDKKKGFIDKQVKYQSKQRGGVQLGQVTNPFQHRDKQHRHKQLGVDKIAKVNLNEILKTAYNTRLSMTNKIQQMHFKQPLKSNLKTID